MPLKPTATTLEKPVEEILNMSPDEICVLFGFGSPEEYRDNYNPWARGLSNRITNTKMDTLDLLTIEHDSILSSQTLLPFTKKTRLATLNLLKKEHAKKPSMLRILQKLLLSA